MVITIQANGSGAGMCPGMHLAPIYKSVIVEQHEGQALHHQCPGYGPAKIGQLSGDSGIERGQCQQHG